MEIDFTFLTLGGLMLLSGYTVTIYNSLVRLKHQVARSWADIDVLLKQRHDELPKLVDTCRQHMAYERDTLERVVTARSRVANAREHQQIGELGSAETELRAGLGKLFALAESYPELKASESFQHLHGRISDLETGIADRREFYNASVNLYNVRIEQFPDLLVARPLRYRPLQLLEFEAQDLEDVNVGALFQP